MTKTEIENAKIGLVVSDCPNCADQASIAAPGETVLCKTHADEMHYSEMRNFFDDNLSDLIFHSHLPFCSSCGTDTSVYYIGYITNTLNVSTSFSFCVDCRNNLTLKKNGVIAAQERIGA